MNHAKNAAPFSPQLEQEQPLDFLIPEQRLSLLTDVLATLAVRLAKQESGHQNPQP